MSATTVFDGASNRKSSSMGRVIAVPVPASVGRPRRKKSVLLFYPRGISAALALSAPAGLPIAKSSLKEMSSGAMESVVYF